MRVCTGAAPCLAISLEFILDAVHLKLTAGDENASREVWNGVARVKGIGEINPVLAQDATSTAKVGAPQIPERCVPATVGIVARLDTNKM